MNILKSKKIDSSDVERILNNRPDLEKVVDISKSIQQNNIMAFDCKLSDEIFNFEDMEEILEEMEGSIDESYFDVVFEDVRAYIKDSMDEIEEELQELYNIDDIRCIFDVYNIDDEFTDFKFVLVIAFEKIKMSSLTNLSKIIARRQLVGGSKFYM